jgi:hypothetical protein
VVNYKFVSHFSRDSASDHGPLSSFSLWLPPSSFSLRFSSSSFSLWLAHLWGFGVVRGIGLAHSFRGFGVVRGIVLVRSFLVCIFEALQSVLEEKGSSRFEVLQSVLRPNARAFLERFKNARFLSGFLVYIFEALQAVLEEKG